MCSKCITTVVLHGVHCVDQHKFSENPDLNLATDCSLNGTLNKTYSEISHLQLT